MKNKLITSITNLVFFFYGNVKTYRTKDIIINLSLSLLVIAILHQSKSDEITNVRWRDLPFHIILLSAFGYSLPYTLNLLTTPYDKEYIKRVRVSILTALLALLVLVYIDAFKAELLKSLNVWGTIAFFVCFGIALFIFREKQRMAYGIVEFICGALAIYSVFQPAKFELNEIPYTLDFSVKIAGGLYIMVRGQDNIVKALKGTNVGKWLAKWGIGS